MTDLELDRLIERRHPWHTTFTLDELAETLGEPELVTRILIDRATSAGIIAAAQPAGRWRYVEPQMRRFDSARFAGRTIARAIRRDRQG